MLAHTDETINIPTDRDTYHAFIRALSVELRLLLFGVAPGATTFRCPTNGRLYADDSPIACDGQLWTRCYWCDTAGRVRGDAGFDRSSPQPHNNPIIVEAADV